MPETTTTMTIILKEGIPKTKTWLLKVAPFKTYF